MCFTGRPRLIRTDGSMRCSTRSTAGTCWTGRGRTCAAIAALLALTVSAWRTSRSTGCPGCSASWPRNLRERRYRPLPARRVFIPKPGTEEKRPLSIPAVRDRVVQAALKIVLEPVFEADFLPCSFGFRPRRSAHDALQVLIDESWQGRRWVVETDIANCFEAIPHCELMQAVEERVCDQAVLALIRTLLRAGVMEGGSLRRSAAGTPQGGVISPLLCNAYLHRLDRAWKASEHGVLVRYADDVVVMCDTREQAEAALARLTVLLANLGLEPKAAKTRIVHLAVGERGVRLPRVPSPAGARLDPEIGAPDLPRPLALTQGGPARPRPDPGDHRPGTAAGADRGHRHGTQHVPARMGQVLPLRKLGPCPRPGRELRPPEARALAV